MGETSPAPGWCSLVWPKHSHGEIFDLISSRRRSGKKA